MNDICTCLIWIDPKCRRQEVDFLLPGWLSVGDREMDVVLLCETVKLT